MEKEIEMKSIIIKRIKKAELFAQWQIERCEKSGLKITRKYMFESQDEKKLMKKSIDSLMEQFEMTAHRWGLLTGHIIELTETEKKVN